MTSPEQTTLQAQRTELARQLDRRLAEQAPLDELQALQSRLLLLDQRLAASTGRSRAIRHHALALLAVAALVSVAALVPLPRVPFALELEAGALQLHMAQAASLSAQVLDGELRADGFTALESADGSLVKRAMDAGVSPIALRAERLMLRRIAFDAGTALAFEASPQGVRVGLEAAAHSVELELSGPVTTSVGGGPRQAAQYPVAEWIKLRADVSPTELWLPRPPEAGYRWRGLQPTSLRLVERQLNADGQVRLQSSLRNATLRLPATEREVRLQEGSTLEIDGLQVDQAELVLREPLKLKLSGSARHIGVQTGGFHQSLEPSLLVYAAHNHGLGLLWSAGALLWGVSTWLRKQFGNTP